VPVALRRRLGLPAWVTAAVALVALASCGGEAPSTAVSTTIAATPSTSTSLPTSNTTPSMNASSTTTPSMSTTSTTSSTTVACARVDVVVLGNSTDFWPNFDGARGTPTADAWPAVAGELLATALPFEVVVRNASVLGAGFDIGLYGVTSMHERLLEIVAADPADAADDVLVLVPSVVDLQLRQRDVDASFAAFQRLHGATERSFALVLVPPMNPVSGRQDAALVDAIAEFNRQLETSGYLDAAYRSSPLVIDRSDVGADEYYDDFDDSREATAGPDPDWLHPDRDGHRAIAEGIAAWLAGRIQSACAG
jgi:hypothetical protein